MRSLARRLANTPDILQAYDNIISELAKRGFIERVQTISPASSVHYIPHHPVKKDSAITPIRIVYDCSCRQSQNQPCLNDCLMVEPTFLNDMCGCLMVEPTFLNDMCGILHCFCSHRYGLSNDIENTFLHVTLNEADHDYTRFLWLSDPTNPESDIIVYRCRAVLFGSVSSPFMVNAAIHYQNTLQYITVTIHHNTLLFHLNLL